MPRRRNLLPLAGFVVCLIALLSYPMFFVSFAPTRDVAWANWLLFAIGLALGGLGIFRALHSPDRYRGRVLGPILGAASIAVVVFFVFMTAIWSRQIPPSTQAPKVGEKAPDFALPDAGGRIVRLSELLGAPVEAPTRASTPWVLLIFYRGYW
jgi:4-amino-4-deoxy-L-arabinose transferase-like glycosyltransferase